LATDLSLEAPLAFGLVTADATHGLKSVAP